MSLADWLGLAVRWIHVLAAIAWIGHAFFFHGIHHHMDQARRKDDEDGEMWMIHGGGFYFLRKTKTLPREVIGNLLWFKWEAGFTWLSGFFLLLLVFYGGGGIYLIDPTVADLPLAYAIGIGIGTLAIGWMIYDLIWATLWRQHAVATALTVGLIVGAVALLTHTLSGRAAYLHVGGLLATIMAANVWMRIIPGQRRMLAQIESGGAPDPDFAARTSARSTHNGYMQFPVVFTMISNHYPSTYGHEHNAFVLMLILALGAAARQLLFDFGRSHPAVYGAGATALAGLAFLTAPRMPEPEPAPVADAAVGQAIDPATVGSITGLIRFEGAPPAPRELVLSGCPSDGPVYDDSVIVRDGALANVFVHLSDGAERWQAPPPPETEVVVDQVGCMYTPHVVGVRAGQPITFLNSDPLPHNVRAVASTNPLFNELTVAKNDKIRKVFKRPELMITTKCDVHPWMTAYVGVVAHPWFAVSGPDGSFHIADVPPGRYVATAWHEVYGTRTAELTVEPSGAASVAFTFAAE